MSDINNVVLVGRFVRDPELKYTQSGTSLASFSVAVGYTYMQNGERKEQTSFFNCTAWGKTGEAIAQYCKKGHRIGIEGRLQQNTWEDQNGNKRSSVDIVVEKFQFLQPRAGDDTPAPAPENTGDNPFSDEDIPF